MQEKLQANKEKCREIAEKLYELDGEVYNCVGSALGRTFTGDRENCIRSLAMLMYTKPDGHLLRSEMALISNMARTIQEKEVRKRLMIKYDGILQEVAALPDTFGSVDILDLARAQLNTSNLRQKFSEDDHLVICIGRTQGSAGNDIGFALADALRINYYDAEIFNQVMKRLEADKDSVNDKASFTNFDKYKKKSGFHLKEWIRDFNRYHGLPTQDAVFFNMSDLICSMARSEDCIIMGRCADAILKNNHIPHISIFIDAPFAIRTQHVMEARNMNFKQASHFLKKMDRQHRKYYQFYSGEKWGNTENYDLCINSASYGIKETVDMIERMIHQQ